ncbi:hypothetical protein OEZ85_001460 [Tetradesmus obliquus]|uniref:DOT1 domain-containing protein n=1 Tax=Tetradesmus obliquus TaxID=3088 RepID=A0ABY8UR45_TETOB|nr:hypothetical protein OEZ85_001460 [Tetradesmus obliquus]
MEALYSVMQGLESRLGGGEGIEGIYGSITATGMHKVLECMRHNCGLGSSSTLVDIGAGLGRPLLHALLLQGAAGSSGSSKATAKGSRAKGLLQQPHSRPIITCASIEQIASLEPCSHAYSFWEGVPLSGKQAFGRLFAQARSMKAVAVVQRAMRGVPPEAHMAQLGFGPLLLIKAFPVNMSGAAL